MIPAMKYTIAHARQHVAEHLEPIMRNFEAHPMPSWMRGCAKVEQVWQSGCWLNHVLREEGASEEEVLQIGFAHGQRSTFGDPWQWAVDYANEYARTKAVQDKPGLELADKINAAFLEPAQ